MTIDRSRRRKGKKEGGDEAAEVEHSGRQKDTRNLNREGGIIFDQKRGLYIASLMVGRKPNGRPDRRYASSKDPKVARWHRTGFRNCGNSSVPAP